MICPRCSGEWKVINCGGIPYIPFTWTHKRQVCSKCGYVDDRMGSVDDEYVGPPERKEEWDKLYPKEKEE